MAAVLTSALAEFVPLLIVCGGAVAIVFVIFAGDSPSQLMSRTRRERDSANRPVDKFERALPPDER
jgi:hypothetical protein